MRDLLEEQSWDSARNLSLRVGATFHCEKDQEWVVINSIAETNELHSIDVSTVRRFEERWLFLISWWHFAEKNDGQPKFLITYNIKYLVARAHKEHASCAILNNVNTTTTFNESHYLKAFEINI